MDQGRHLVGWSPEPSRLVTKSTEPDTRGRMAEHHSFLLLLLLFREGQQWRPRFRRSLCDDKNYYDKNTEKVIFVLPPQCLVERGQPSPKHALIPRPRQAQRHPSAFRDHGNRKHLFLLFPGLADRSIHRFNNEEALPFPEAAQPTTGYCKKYSCFFLSFFFFPFFSPRSP